MSSSDGITAFTIGTQPASHSRISSPLWSRTPFGYRHSRKAEGECRDIAQAIIGCDIRWRLIHWCIPAAENIKTFEYAKRLFARSPPITRYRSQHRTHRRRPMQGWLRTARRRSGWPGPSPRLGLILISKRSSQRFALGECWMSSDRFQSEERGEHQEKWRCANFG